jgi:hypothetical protein
MLDYSIRDPITPSISPVFYGWTGRGGALYHGIRVEVLDSIPPVTQFSAARIPPSLASVGPTCTATSEQEQATPTAMTPHAGGKMLDYSIRGPLTLSYQLGSMVGLAKRCPLANIYS